MKPRTKHTRIMLIHVQISLAIALGCDNSTPVTPNLTVTLNPSTVDIHEGRSAIVYARTNTSLQPGEQFYWQYSGARNLFCLYPNDPKYIQVLIEGWAHGFDTILVRLSFREQVKGYLTVTVRHVSLRSIVLIADTSAISIGSGKGAVLSISIFDSVGARLRRSNIEWILSDTLVAGIYWAPSWNCLGDPTAGVFGLQPGQVSISAKSDGVLSNSVVINIYP